MSTMLSKPLTSIAAALRGGEISSLELVEAAIARHEDLGGHLNAYKAWNADEARVQARAADAAFMSGVDLGPLQGMPISVKDLYGLKGWPTYAGTPKRLPKRWEQEGPVISALRRQLGVAIGKTHTVELAFGGLGVNPHWGTPRNPWDAKAHRVPGGSSSGAGVSLWEGSALAALGTDTAGSVRVPASMTGNVGLKTSFGRWSTQHITPLSSTLDTAGVLARSVADLTFAFSALDPAWDTWAALDKAISGFDLSDLRIGMAGPPLWDDCSPGIVEAARAALDALGKKGARIKDTPIPEAKTAIELLHVGSIASAECDAFLEAELPEWRDLIDPIIKIRIADGGAITARELLLRYRKLEELSDTVVERFRDLDVIACPTVAITPPTVEEVSDLNTYRKSNMASLRNTCIVNYLSLCAITIPVGLDKSGMPVGLQLIACHGEEERLLAIGLAMERAFGTPIERFGVPPLTPGL